MLLCFVRVGAEDTVLYDVLRCVQMGSAVEWTAVTGKGSEHRRTVVVHSWLVVSA